ncbi:MAG: hypothetical protein ACI4O7_13425 [Aristaeellaceae bacterium]
MKMENVKLTRIMNIACAVLALVLLVLQFTPFWYMGGETEPVSIGGYVWFPSDHGEVTSYLQEQVSSDFKVNDVIAMPILVLLLSVATIVLCVWKMSNPLVSLLPIACGLCGVWGFLAKAAFRLGSTWGFQFALCIALIALGAVALAMGLKKEAK